MKARCFTIESSTKQKSILDQLIGISHYCGAPSRQYVILGEGNTAARIDEDTFLVKASGVHLGTATANDFLALSISALTELLDNPAADDADVTTAFRNAMLDKNDSRRPSVESILHALLLTLPEYAFIVHTHPMYTGMILCSQHAAEAATGRLFPDHIVSLGHKSVFVPYVDPGLTLAREIRRRLHAFVKTEGVLPNVIMMENHGIIVMGNTPQAVISTTDMTEKASQILVGAYGMGGPKFLTPDQVHRINTRPDEVYRIRLISGQNA